MKSYPSITTKIDFKKSFILFDKIDGSNIRAEWNVKKGFYKFGSRTQLLTPDQVTLYPVIAHVMNNVAEKIQPKLVKLKAESVVCFFEWAGPNSFAGSHTDSIEDMTATLIDVSVYKTGMLAPEKFVDIFEDVVKLPKILHNGKISEELFQSIRKSELDGMTFEGVVGKEANCTKDGRQDLCKIKTNAWLDKLKTVCNGDMNLYERLK